MIDLKMKKVKMEQLKPAKYNPRMDLQAGDPEYEKIKRSIETFGMVEPIIWNEKTGNIVGGHQRYKVLKDLGWKDIEVSAVDLSDEEEKTLNIALNKISGDWDNTLLKDLLQELDTGAIDIELTGFDEAELENMMTAFYEDDPADESNYTDKIETPVYEPQEEDAPAFEQMYDTNKADDLISDIEAAKIPKGVKDFLTFAAYRHVVFDYANIAEYYCHADKEIQELMERSALVIIDFKKAIEEGYVMAMESIEEMRTEDDEEGI